MTYSGTYDADDIDDIVLDFLGTYGAQLVPLAGIIALVFIYRWYKGGGRSFM